IDNDQYNPDPVYGAIDREHIPYFNEPWTHEPAGESFWSPNRIMPGPGMFGSLPSGVYGDATSATTRPWQTLLFRPLWDSSGRGIDGSTVHPGFRDPKDHYLLDFFWMPVVEPCSISEAMSTAGKVNLNYAMQPFSHIKRTSALLGVFSSEEMLTIPNDWGRSYKQGTGFGRGYDHYAFTGGDLRQPSLRSHINAAETLRQFDQRFNSPSDSFQAGDGDLFRTASEICEQWLVPFPVRFDNHPNLNENLRLEDMPRVWNPDSSNGLGLVGDNSKERPYSNLVARLTTKSNTFQVHYRAQIVRQAPFSPVNPGNRRSDDEWAIFDSDVDGVVGEYRGSTTIERYLDPNDTSIPDYAELTSEPSGKASSISPLNLVALDQFYRFRVLSEKRFAP
ncbi:MAG: Verru_Chthon cassette protein A, partial [Verrucomicrobiota bacterium]